MKMVKEKDRLSLIKRIHRQAPPGTEHGVSAYDVSWLIAQAIKAERLEKQLKQALGVLEGVVSISREALYEENRDSYALRVGLVNVEARAHRCVSYLTNRTEDEHETVQR